MLAFPPKKQRKNDEHLGNKIKRRASRVPEIAGGFTLPPSQLMTPELFLTVSCLIARKKKEKRGKKGTTSTLRSFRSSTNISLYGHLHCSLFFFTLKQWRQFRFFISQEKKKRRWLQPLPHHFQQRVLGARRSTRPRTHQRLENDPRRIGLRSS